MQDYANFDKAKKKTLKWEGGYCNVKGDTGGETIFGISRNNHPNLNLWKIMDEFKQDFEGCFDKSKYKELEKSCLNNKEFCDEMEELYKKKFWDAIRGDDIKSQEVANALFDHAVNSGPGRAIKHLQEVLGLKVDGVFGPKTLAAVNEMDGKTLCNRLCDRRVEFYRNISSKGQNIQFLNGWLKRAKDFYV